MQLILGSTSPYKRQLLETLNLDFVCEDSEVDEQAHHQATVEQTVQTLAGLKAQELLNKYRGTDTLIITSDVAGELDGKFLGKPSSLTEAKHVLASYSNKQVLVWCGTCVAQAQTGIVNMHIEKAVIDFLEITAAMINEYTQTTNVLDKGGALAIEQVEQRGWVKSITGEYAAIIGLSTKFVQDQLTRYNVKH
jgi:septum formation protein